MEKSEPDGKVVISYVQPQQVIESGQPRWVIAEATETFPFREGWSFKEEGPFFTARQTLNEGTLEEHHINRRYGYASIISIDHLCNTVGYMMRMHVWQWQCGGIGQMDHQWGEPYADDYGRYYICCDNCQVYQHELDMLAEMVIEACAKLPATLLPSAEREELLLSTSAYKDKPNG
jgi:hypothetical protein